MQLQLSPQQLPHFCQAAILTLHLLKTHTLSLSHHISPCSIGTYLSSIVPQLEPYFPGTCTIQNSKLVQQTLQGCLRLHAMPTRQKRVLTIANLQLILHSDFFPSHDDLLFHAMVLTGFFALLWLSEMAFPDDSNIQDWRRDTPCQSLTIGMNSPSHSIKLTITLLATISLYTMHNLMSTPTCISFSVFAPVTHCTPSILLYG